jgi:hypothetical protein
VADVIVKHNEDGTVTVCIDEQCVTVPGSPRTGGRHRRPPIVIQLASRRDTLGDIDELDWEHVPESGGIQQAEHGGVLLTRVQRETAPHA